MEHITHIVCVCVYINCIVEYPHKCEPNVLCACVRACLHKTTQSAATHPQKHTQTDGPSSGGAIQIPSQTRCASKNALFVCVLYPYLCMHTRASIPPLSLLPLITYLSLSVSISLSSESFWPHIGAWAQWHERAYQYKQHTRARRRLKSQQISYWYFDEVVCADDEMLPQLSSQPQQQQPNGIRGYAFIAHAHGSFVKSVLISIV